MSTRRLNLLATAVFAGAFALGVGLSPGVSFATDPVPSEFEINDSEPFGSGDPVADIAGNGCGFDVPDWDDIFTDSGGDAHVLSGAKLADSFVLVCFVFIVRRPQ